MKRIACILSVCLVAAGIAQAAIVHNGDFSTAVAVDTSVASTIAGNDGYVLDGSGAITNVTVGGTTGTSENQWFISQLTSLPTWGASAGSGGTGDGAMVFVPLANANDKPRGIIQFAHDGGAMTGTVRISIDIKFNLTGTGMFGNIELYGWNDGEVAPILSLGGAGANSPVYNVTIPGGAVNLLGGTGVQIAASGFSADAWKTVTVTNTLDLGDGYDYYAWRVGLVGADGPNDMATFDNLEIIPASETTAVINPSATRGYIPLEIVFDGSDSLSSGTITNYVWAFGDGNTASGVLATNTYVVVGDYTVWLTVMDDQGNIASNSILIAVENQPVAAVATATPISGEVPLEVVFDGSGSAASTGGSIASYAWTFGDGNSDFGVVVTNTYAAEGVYTATLVVTDSNGQSDSSTVSINVRPVSLVEIATQTAGTTASDPFPATFIPVSTNDLANTNQASFLSLDSSNVYAGSATNGFNGIVPGAANSMDDRVGTQNSTVFTVNFDTSVNTLGYDITNINTYAAWDPTGNGRANQGYDVTVTFMDGSTLLVSSGTYEPNNTPNAWTAVYMSGKNGGVIASGVKAVTFSNFDVYKAAGNPVIVYREFDVLGKPTGLSGISDFTIGMVSGSQVVLSWKGGGTYDVCTNANLVYPNWGIAIPGASSPVTNAVGSEPQLFYELRN